MSNCKEAFENNLIGGSLEAEKKVEISFPYMRSSNEGCVSSNWILQKKESFALRKAVPKRAIQSTIRRYYLRL